jgi:hypothetical protein
MTCPTFTPFFEITKNDNVGVVVRYQVSQRSKVLIHFWKQTVHMTCNGLAARDVHVEACIAFLAANEPILLKNIASGKYRVGLDSISVHHINEFKSLCASIWSIRCQKAAKHIQRQWRKCNTNPYYVACRNRLQWEIQEMGRI